MSNFKPHTRKIYTNENILNRIGEPQKLKIRTADEKQEVNFEENIFIANKTLTTKNGCLFTIGENSVMCFVTGRPALKLFKETTIGEIIPKRKALEIQGHIVHN